MKNFPEPPPTVWLSLRSITRRDFLEGRKLLIWTTSSRIPRGILKPMCFVIENIDRLKYFIEHYEGTEIIEHTKWAN